MEALKNGTKIQTLLIIALVPLFAMSGYNTFSGSVTDNQLLQIKDDLQRESDAIIESLRELRERVNELEKHVAALEERTRP